MFLEYTLSKEVKKNHSNLTRNHGKEVGGLASPGSFTDLLCCPVEKTNRILAPEFEIDRFSGNILRKALFRFQPDALELRTERHVNFLIFSALHDHSFPPPGLTDHELGSSDLLNHQAVIRHQPAVPV